MKSPYIIITDSGHHLRFFSHNSTKRKREDFGLENNNARNPEKFHACLNELEKRAEKAELRNKAKLDEFYSGGDKFTEERLEEDQTFCRDRKGRGRSRKT